MDLIVATFLFVCCNFEMVYHKMSTLQGFSFFLLFVFLVSISFIY